MRTLLNSTLPILYLSRHILQYKADCYRLLREVRASNARVYLNTEFSAKQQAFLDFVLQHCVTVGVAELDPEKLTPLLKVKYHDSIADAMADLGSPAEIGRAFAPFQQHLYCESR